MFIWLIVGGSHFIQLKLVHSGLYYLSKFKDIYDENHFVSTLENDVRVVNKLPDYIMERFDRNMSNVLNFRVKAWSPIEYYDDVVLPKLLEEQ